MTRSVRQRVSARQKPYHLVSDRKSRRTILCATTSQNTGRKEIGAQDSVDLCQEFIRLRGTLAARWKISKRRKYKRLMDRAVEFNDKRMEITGISSSNRLNQQVRHSYQLWKQHAKQGILERLRANLKDTLIREYKLSEEDAILQGGLEDDILDSSDEEQ
ncbi:hypothetical protein R1sor_025536 [Riccia sorocarpa]|uniref:Uncharacterized protein n=1 Tax=Riccia sorocarpa TaxID=122646 RepID=A0ABD3G8X0_9MARC